MNPGAPPPPGTKTSARCSSGYRQKALAEIRNSLRPFANVSGNGDGSYRVPPNMTGSPHPSDAVILQTVSQLFAQGYDEESALRVLKAVGGRHDVALEKLSKLDNLNGPLKESPLSALGTMLIRKPSLERELNLHRGSPALDSGAGSSRSDSPRLSDISHPHEKLSRQYSPSFGDAPPLPPPRCSSTPPPPPPHPVQQLLKRMSPAPPVPSPRGTSPSPSPAPRQPMIVQNGPQVQQQFTQQMQALSIYPSPTPELPPPYPLPGPPPPPPYSVSIQNRQSPTQSHQDYRKSPSSGIYSGGTSAGSPSPITVSQGTPTPTPMARPTPLQAWGARQAKTQQPIIMQSVKSTQVQKPILQTAIAPVAPQNSGTPSPSPSSSPSPLQPPPPSYASSIQQKQQAPSYPTSPKPPTPTSCQGPTPVSGSSPIVPTTEPPSYAITMQALAAQRHQLPPPPPYGIQQDETSSIASSQSAHSFVYKKLQANNTDSRPDSEQSTSSGDSPCLNSSPYAMCGIKDMSTPPPLPPTSSSSVASKLKVNACPVKKIRHQSPIPERKHMSKEKEDERRDCKVRNYSPQAFKFFMEQHVENVVKSYRQRLFRRMQLEKEMTKIGLSSEAQLQMRKLLSQKESNYIRLKRAKMDKSMFTKIKPIGVGAFGEVTLVKKTVTKHLYAMKTLRKADVLKRNQVAHVKAERDILAEADNEWVVKLYYSFQDRDNLYFVMDYIPGGDLMSLLIKFGVFEEALARFYIAELTCAVESVHKMGFIHRDIKPDNILIDKDGHIKLTDFGLCTGFRWTHNSKYYQRNGEHGRQDSMEPDGEWREGECKCKQLKPLERRRRREHQRCLAHSLVGTPNYIAPEVLQRTGYTQLCDWWSVGVILFEMLVGSPPFLASTPAETQYKVIHWQTTLHIPISANLSKDSTDLTLKLCSGSDTRLGKDANEVKRHPFFKDIDFEKGFRRQPAPYIPKIEFDTDTSNFDPVDPERLRNSSSSDSNRSDNETSDNGGPYHGFFEFTFRRFFDEGGSIYPNRISLDDTENQGPVYV